jgi:hypothetical protein
MQVGLGRLNKAKTGENLRANGRCARTRPNLRLRRRPAALADLLS